ncbi:MAG: LEPR-XLL domain-containing protein, partial [Planctomycetota bacterium]|nr:LEPR-XLL domain-containing protein [Planctomycetota bacterium]
MRKPSSKRPHTRKNHLSFETLEDRVLLNADYRAINGYDNNLAHPDWGSAGVQLERYVASQYADGYSAPAGPLRPSPRAISNAVAAQEHSVVNDRYLTDFVWQWGQFLDHDIDLTESADPAEPMDIPVPAGDPYFDPDWTGTHTIEMNRSVYDVTTGTTTARQQLNQITAYVDASNVYGSDQDRADFLREFVGGKLKTSDGNLLPYNDGSQPNQGSQGTNLFVAGDVRANEQVALTAMHTLFMREHNRLAAKIADAE